MKILTYNIHRWQDAGGRDNTARVLEVLQAANADIIALNEVLHPHPWPAGDQPALQQVAAHLGMHYVFAPAQGRELAFAPEPHNEGNALLSRWPILASAAHHLRTRPEVRTRGLLEVRVQPPQDQPLTCYVTHLDPHDEDIRLAQAKALLSWTVRDRQRPHVLLGDLNTYNPADYPDASLLQTQCQALGWTYYEAQVMPFLLQNGYVDAFAAAGVGSGVTHAAFRIDYILLGQALAGRLQRCHTLVDPPADTASDHVPLLAELAD